MATLYLMVGLPCSGKTTKAKELEDELLAIRLTPDEWHVNLFGHDIADPEHDKRHYLIEDMLWQIAARALSLGPKKLNACTKNKEIKTEKRKRVVG